MSITLIYKSGTKIAESPRQLSNMFLQIVSLIKYQVVSFSYYRFAYKMIYDLAEIGRILTDPCYRNSQLKFLKIQK